ncbi:MAG: NAD-dependent epimerase/dehydratase family protein [Acidobacteria bacterium]|nr:NAD-dependent epimerase/dehydratase family protein [Acidobacteriota bacterium]
MESSFWKDRRVFVTGGTGFVGANLVNTLKQLGASVICLRRDHITPSSLDALGIGESVSFVDGSVEDHDLIERVLNENDVDTVFHLAAQAIVGSANRSPLSTFETNIRGTYMLLEACRRSPLVTRVVVASSDKAYGDQTELPYTEDLKLNARYPYDVSKACTDMISASFAATYGLPVAVSRSANIYGPADLNLSRIIPGTIISVLKGEDPIVRSDGTPVREFIYVDDVVSGYLALAENIEAASGQAFNFGTNAPVRIIDLVSTIIEACGASDTVSPNVLLKEKIKNEIDAQYLSGDKMRDVTGWSAAVSLEEGIVRTVDWYRAKLELWKLTLLRPG